MNKLLTNGKLILFSFLLSFHIESFAQNKCIDLFKVIIPKSGAQILHEKDNRLHTAPFVEKSVRQEKAKSNADISKPTDKLNVWLESLTQMAKKSETSPLALEKVKSALQKTFVIKDEDVPQGYYDLQVQIARQRGYGEIQLTEAQKKELADNVVIDQKKSLDSWTEYLVSKDTSMYPMWLKYWMYTGMTKLSKYDPQTGIFGSRNKNTVAPFVEINREALGLTVDSVLKYMNKTHLEDIQDPALSQLLSGLNFGKIYGHFLLKLNVGKEGSFKTNQGKWVVYAKGSDHRPLVNSLEGRNTGWCTAGESTAKSQLKKGAFHVYYSLDEHGKPTIPRVAVRMENDEIGEVRGVAKDQNLDPQISQSDIVSLKMKEFGSKADRFQKRDHNMKLLTDIESKTIANLPLTTEELRFLYELDSKIEGFGYQKDPRINEIKSKRDCAKELSDIFGGIEKYKGDLDLTGSIAAEGLILPEFFEGTLNLPDLKSAKGLVLPKNFKGKLYLNGLTSVEGLVLPETFEGILHLGLTSAEGLVLPKTFNGKLQLLGLTSAEGLVIPETFKGTLHLLSLTSAKGLVIPETFEGKLQFVLASAEGLVIPETFKGTLDLLLLSSDEELVLPKNFKGKLHLPGRTSAKGLVLPETFEGTLQLALVSAEGLVLPKTFNGKLQLLGLTSAEGLVLPKNFSGDLFLSGLKSAKDLVIPDGKYNIIGLHSLTSVKDLNLPKSFNGTLLMYNVKKDKSFLYFKFKSFFKSLIPL